MVSGRTTISLWERMTCIWPFAIGAFLSACFFTALLDQALHPVKYAVYFCGTPAAERGTVFSSLLVFALPLGLWGAVRALTKRLAKKSTRSSRITGCLALVTLGLLLAPVLLAVVMPRPDRVYPQGVVASSVHEIQILVQSWAVDNRDTYPDPSLVGSQVLGSIYDSWPSYIGGHQAERGTGAGDFQYFVNQDRTEYKLVGYAYEGHPVCTVTSPGWPPEQ